MRRDNPLDSQIPDILRRLRELETQSPLSSSSITRGQLRVASNEGFLVEGSQKVSGWLVVTGTERVVGRLEGTGVFDWSGDMYLRGAQNITGPVTFDGSLRVNGPIDVYGPWKLIGNGEIVGNAAVKGNVEVTGPSRFANTLTIDGAATLNSDLTVANGRIVCGPLTIDRSGPYGGRISGSTIQLAAGTITATGNISATGTITTLQDLVALGKLDVAGVKSFRIEHPTKPGHWLRHGATESPVSGTEYAGRARLNSDGEAIVRLPDYFESLNKAEGRTVQVTPVGRPFAVGASDVDEGLVTIYGESDREVYWLVKAERRGADFLVEEQYDAAA